MGNKGSQFKIAHPPSVAAGSEYARSSIISALYNNRVIGSPERVWRKLLAGDLSYLDEASKAKLDTAFKYANKGLHKHPHINGHLAIYHSLAIVEILAKLQIDHQTLCAAFLLNVVQVDRGAPDQVAVERVQEVFGVAITKLVVGIGRLGQIRFSHTLETEAENFKKMLLAMSEDVRVMIVHLANRLENMRRLDRWPAEERRATAKRTLEIYAPIAERLGLYFWARELQDTCLRVRYPNRYQTLSTAIAKREGNRKQVVAKLTASLDETLKNAGVGDYRISGRRKTVYSVYRKMSFKGKSFDQIYDLHGFRVIVDTPETCYRVLGIIHMNYKPVHGRFHDYIAIPKANGYQSLHTVVVGPHGDRLEVQIRTREMDRVAEAGVAAHWVYKSGEVANESNNHLARQWLLELLETNHQGGNPIEFLEHLKSDLYPDEVYVFTPKGDIRKLPRGATALDFAFAVHTNVGLHSSGVRINAELASLPTVLKNGDRVEIITAKEVTANSAWLNYAITAKARTQIRHHLRQQTEREALALGKRLLAGATKQRMFGRRKVSAKVQEKILQELKLDNWSQLLVEIGQGNRVADIVARQIARFSDVTAPPKESHTSESLVIKGSEGLLVTYPKCCSPIPGDIIIGIFSAGHGLTIHTTECHNTAEIQKQPERCLMVEWDDDVDGLFQTRIQVKLRHISGAFAQVATAIAESDSNIIHIDSHEGLGEIQQIDFVVEVRDRRHLAHLMKLVYRRPCVSKVTRKNG